MKLKFYCYPRCTTCQKAKKYLEAKGVDFETIDIKLTPPTAKELKEIHQKSGLELKKFFNTSGNSYRALNLKDTFNDYKPAELYKLLAQDGMLIKRPLIIGDDFVLVGFKEEDIDQVL